MMDSLTYGSAYTEIELSDSWARALGQYCKEKPSQDVCKAFRRMIAIEDIRYRITG